MRLRRRWPEMPRPHSAALGPRGSAPLPGTAAEQRGLPRTPTPRAPARERRSARAAPSAARRSQFPAGRRAELGRSASQAPAQPRRPIPSPPLPKSGARRRSRPGVRPSVPQAAVASEPLLPLPPLAMGPGSRLLLPLALCVGLGALVPSAGASGVSRRGPSVTAKVTERRAATCLRAGQGDGGASGTGSSASAEERRGLPGRGGREAAAGLGGRGLAGARGAVLSGETWGRWAQLFELSPPGRWSRPTGLARGARGSFRNQWALSPGRSRREYFLRRGGDSGTQGGKEG